MPVITGAPFILGGSTGFKDTDAVVRVKAPSNSVVTMTKGSTTKQFTIALYLDSTYSIFYCYIPSSLFDSSSWTVKAYLNGGSKQTTVIVSAACEYDVILNWNVPIGFTELTYIQSDYAERIINSDAIDTSAIKLGAIPTTSVSVYVKQTFSDISSSGSSLSPIFELWSLDSSNKFIRRECSASPYYESSGTVHKQISVATYGNSTHYSREAISLNTIYDNEYKYYNDDPSSSSTWQMRWMLDRSYTLPYAPGNGFNANAINFTIRFWSSAFDNSKATIGGTTIEQKEYVLRGRFYSARVVADGTERAIFLPCRRDSDNRLGVYEKKSNTFCPCNTTVGFIAGGVVQ